MKNLEEVSLRQMKEALIGQAGSKFPIRITLRNGEVVIRYARGFADEQKNILLISENAYSLAMKILEVKEIGTLEFAQGNAAGEWKVLRGKWHGRTASTHRIPE